MVVDQIKTVFSIKQRLIQNIDFNLFQIKMQNLLETNPIISLKSYPIISVFKQIQTEKY